MVALPRTEREPVGVHRGIAAETLERQVGALFYADRKNLREG